MPKRRSANEPQLVRGALFMLRRKCGKPTCRCATGEPHETPALTYTEAGRSKTLTLTGADVDAVRAALARYNQARAELDRAADAGIAALRSAMTASRSRPRR